MKTRMQLKAFRKIWTTSVLFLGLLICLFGLWGFSLQQSAKYIHLSTDFSSQQKINASLKEKVEVGEEEKANEFNQLLARASRKALGGGLSGAVAGGIQVITFMWLRTIVNYQCRYGTTFMQAFVTLRNEGGIRRFYRGLGFALVQAPLARFGATYSNDGVAALMEGLVFTKHWGPGRVTFVASVFVGIWRIFLMPIDTCKTVLQVDSAAGFRNLMRRVKAGKIRVMYQGAIATSISSILGNYPWFLTYNLLSKSESVSMLFGNKLLKNAGIGVVASIVSDTAVNAIRVIKTTKQSVGCKRDIGYIETAQMVLAASGWKGLLGRGLSARIIANALQSIIFTIIWRSLAENW